MTQITLMPGNDVTLLRVATIKVHQEYLGKNNMIFARECALDYDLIKIKIKTFDEKGNIISEANRVYNLEPDGELENYWVIVLDNR